MNNNTDTNWKRDDARVAGDMQGKHTKSHVNFYKLAKNTTKQLQNKLIKASGLHVDKGAHGRTVYWRCKYDAPRKYQ
jgi:hypothetical protein